MSEQAIIKVEHLSHKYHSSWAIRDINFEINKCGILGLLGSNGAGKSTTMNIMCGVLNQTAGKVFIEGIDLNDHPREAKRLIGFLPQTPPLHLDLTVDEYLIHCAGLRRIEKKNIPSALEMAKERCGLTHFSKRLIRNLSGGYRQRVGIAQAIIHKPRLVVLDEPTNGLDPNQILEVRKLIREIAEERAVVFSTHILSEVEVLCEEIKMIEKGRLVFSGTKEEFRNLAVPTSMIISLNSPPPDEIFYSIRGVVKVDTLSARQFRIHFSEGDDITNDIVEMSVRNRWQLKELNIEKNSLDLIFSKLSNYTTR